MRVALISTYELGRQPFGIASPTAWLKEAGIASVECLDLAVEPLREELIQKADLVAIYVPMHTATRLAIPLMKRVKALNPGAHLCCFGLYAALNANVLRENGANTLLGGEFEQDLLALVHRLSVHSETTLSARSVSLARQTFRVPDRRSLPDLKNYAHLILPSGEHRVVGYTESSRGCKHLCRHCPIPPVYGGIVRVVQRDVVLADIKQQVHAGAQHITFGDPDFFNGPLHAIAIVEALHAEFPSLTYDVTIKIEHLLQHARHLTTLRDTGCVLVTSAVESVDDRVLAIFEKRHTRADFVRAVQLCRDTGLALNPTFVTFHPWTTRAGYVELLETLHDLDLVENISPIQYAIRLLLPPGSSLLGLPFIQEIISDLDEEALIHPWLHPDPAVDELYTRVLDSIKAGQARHDSRQRIFATVWELAQEAVQNPRASFWPLRPRVFAHAATSIPQLSEPWYC
jgi:radical SAM superfamily enzyme YgiQ (UPF0313 family)